MEVNRFIEKFIHLLDPVRMNSKIECAERGVRMASAIGTMKYLTTPLSPALNRGLEFAKLRAQERNVRLTERQRIGRDGCVQAVLARFLMLSEEEQDKFIDEGVKKLVETL